MRQKCWKNSTLVFPVYVGPSLAITDQYTANNGARLNLGETSVFVLQCLTATASILCVMAFIKRRMCARNHF